jgi:hypothetical protein
MKEFIMFKQAVGLQNIGNMGMAAKVINFRIFISGN